MLITKIIEVGLNVQNCIGIYANPDNIMQRLIDRLEGRCFKGCYIKSVDKIRRIGDCIINQDGPPTFGTIPVICEVTAIVYAVGEVINGCVVKNRDKNNNLICGTGTTSIILTAGAVLASIVKGQIISVRVGQARYIVGASEIAVNAVPYLPNAEVVAYKFGAIDNETKGLLTDILARISFEEDEMARLKRENGKAWDTFDQMLYAYKDPQSAPTTITIKELLTSDAERKYVSRDPRLNLSTDRVCVYTNRADIPVGAKIHDNLPIANVLILILEDYCAHLRTIREMIATYSSEQLLLSHKNLWQIFRKSKV